MQQPHQQQQQQQQQPDHKYDRQLRLWGVHGQMKLSNSHICLINASATGTETLKNLVLPGIGKFTILDPNLVSEVDLANNFFVTQDWLGKSRAQAATVFLTELNPDVKGIFLVANGVDMASKDEKIFEQYTLVIATQMNEKELILIEKACLKCNVPLVVARTNGLLGHVRLCGREHCVMESKPSPEPQQDLRIFNPFPQLRQIVDTYELAKLDEQQYGHVPFVVILIKALDSWRLSHNGNSPNTFTDKQEFVQSLKNMSRLGYGSEENLIEAVDKAYLAYGVRPIPEDVCAVLQNVDDKLEDPFWMMAKALNDFVKSHDNCLPLPGTLPDLTSTTEGYIQLQRCYRAKANEDLQFISNLLVKNKQIVSNEDLQIFCANAYHLHSARFSPLEIEFSNKPMNSEVVNEACMEGVGDVSSQSPILWYICWRAFDSFDSRSDEKKLLEVAKDLCTKTYGIDANLITDKHAKETLRFGGSEPHNIAALIGGIASQEAVKLVTKQYIPLNNTYLFNGIAGIGACFKL